jgi:NADPH2:quinone reductase
MASTAQALIVDAYGDWRDVRLGTITVPDPGPGEVLIAAEAAALNFPDILMIAGKYQRKPPLPFTPGRDVAGRVLAIGSGVTRVAPGDRVSAQCTHGGAFATRVLVPQAFCVPIPEALSFVDAAAAGTVLATVVAALGLRARLQAGQLVLITGAAGGVGSAAIQYARLLGARVAAVVSSAEKEAACRELGAEIVLRTDTMPNLRDGMRAALPDGADVVLDVVGGDLFDAVLRCVRPGGSCIVVGFTSGRIPTVQTNYLLLKDIALIGSSLSRLFDGQEPEFEGLLAEGFRALAERRMRIPVEGCYKLADFATAMARIEGRQVLGKIVLFPL